MSAFDLTREPWIPVRFVDSSSTASKEISLRTALKKAHRIREIYAGTPLQTVALYRLLQALFIRMFWPVEGDEVTNDDEDRWWALYDEGEFDALRVDAYFDEWQGEKHCFDLLHPERPFMQHPEPMTSLDKSVSILFAGMASGNNETIFDHTVDGETIVVSLAEAARGVMATQATALRGGRSKPFYYADAPLAAGAVFWIRGANRDRGETLFESLLLNTPPTTSGLFLPAGGDGDAPFWERMWTHGWDEPTKRTENGYLDYLTWPSRRLLLLTNQTDDGTTVATEVRISQGNKRTTEDRPDPLMARVQSKSSGLLPIKMDDDRALWRDADILMQAAESQRGVPPPTIQWAANAFPESRWFVDAFGLVNDQAKIERWEQSRMPIYPIISTNPTLREVLRDALAHARKQQGILQRATRECAAQLLFPGKAQPGSHRTYDALGSQGKRDARELAESMGTVTRYWATLEDPFFEWLAQLGTDQFDDVRIANAKWAQTLHDRARKAYDAAAGSLGESARHARAIAAGRSRLAAASAYAELVSVAS
jgi:CRISPR system Cascade subunit CasA